MVVGLGPIRSPNGSTPRSSCWRAGWTLIDATRHLARRYRLSERQARRYVERARDEGAMEVPGPKVVFTVKLPAASPDGSDEWRDHRAEHLGVGHPGLGGVLGTSRRHG